MDKNIKKWPQTETGSQIGAFTLSLRTQNKQKKSICMSVCPSACLPVCLSVCLHDCLSVWLYVRTCILAVDTITFEEVNGSKQNLVGVF